MEGANSNTPLWYVPTVGHRYYQTKKGLEEVTLPFFSWSLALWSLTKLHFFLKQSCSPGKKLSWQRGWGTACSPGNHGGYRRTKPGSLTSFNLQDFLQKVWPLLPPLLFFLKKELREKREAPASCSGECFLSVLLKWCLPRNTISKSRSGLGMNKARSSSLWSQSGLCTNPE